MDDSSELVLAPASGGERSFGFWAGVFCTAAAAGAYYGLAAFDGGGYEIVPSGIKGLLLWLLIKLVGRLWLTAGLAMFAALFFGMFIGSFKPRPRIVRKSDT